ncbi:class I SAM-dependent methyltransferase [Aquihabitans sp. G128]|uniref:class I SAM-dependent methyltransferase n=1 Tax=Aquihabitans sp. G128 TaxID=2849779 RepID=UPI001C2102D1|nr:class I SAM-dependent methyltransferase [Aquihabitans sp. G128]QXC63110.1 class I SAM-dependent methyltransferase [Aquihabitans sp. G128]
MTDGLSHAQVPAQDVLAFLSDPSVGLAAEAQAAFALGTVLGRDPEPHLASLADLLRRPSAPLPGRALATLVLGMALERDPEERMGPHPLAEQLGPPWAVLGHLVSAERITDPVDRALVLLGGLVERDGLDPRVVLAHLGDDDWQMSVGERALVLLLSAALRPPLAVDAGTFLGRSAAALALSSQRVTSIDWGVERGAHVTGLDRVDFRCGRAADVLDEVLAAHPECNLVVLDADHGAEGIAAEVEAVLRHPNVGLRAVVVHDVDMPSCRAGLASVPWDDRPQVRGRSLDFISGTGGTGGVALLWVASEDPTLPT